MPNVAEHEIFSLLQDENFVNEIIGQALESPDVMDDLAEDIAEDVSDFFEDYPRLRRHLLTPATAKGGFKNRIIQKLIEELQDESFLGHP